MKDNLDDNYRFAKEEADRIDAQIIDAVERGAHFKVEAGAGSGKTYSLIRVIDWLRENRRHVFAARGQQAICITYTNAAVEVISNRIGDDETIVPSTIHAFAWSAIKQYQEALVEVARSSDIFERLEEDLGDVCEVKYTLGSRYIDDHILYLYHDDVLKLFAAMLEKAKFRRVFASRYPIILIDEYQDSYGPIIECFLEHFISVGSQPQFGFFGDSWQTIYQSNKACGSIDHEKIETIKKVSNFRSAQNIINLLNLLRPDLPQRPAIDDEGAVLVVTNADYLGPRQDQRNFKGDLPFDVLRERLEKVEKHMGTLTPEGESTKVLMLTHRLLANQQGYEKLEGMLRGGIKDGEDEFLNFFMEKVEPIFAALINSNAKELFNVLGMSRPPIRTKKDKVRWRELKEALEGARDASMFDVLDAVIASDLIPVPPNLQAHFRDYRDGVDRQYSDDASLREMMEVEYQQFLNAIEFLKPESLYSTEHGVKGEEYDNVIFVIGKGWNQYQFDVYAPMILDASLIPQDKMASYERNRNLFYVCCSRPKKRLLIFVTIPIDNRFDQFLSTVADKKNIWTYGDFLKVGSLD